LNKRTLMLSAATLALLSVPAMADTDITAVNTASHKTSTDGNITIETGGGVTFKSATVPIITIDSSNTVINSGTINGSGQTTETAVLIDTTAAALTGSFTSTSGTIDLTGVGDHKIGLHLITNTTTPNAFTGSFILGNTSIVGDSSEAVLTDTGTILNGDITLGGAIAVSSTSDNESAPSGIAVALLNGTINGNVTVAAGSALTSIGNGAQGIVITGPLLACNTAAVPGCTETGTFANYGSISASGVPTRSLVAANAEGGPALVIGGSVAGGILNNGATNAADTVNLAAVIDGNGTGATSAVVVISPQIAGVGINIGTLGAADATNGTFSFVNRGTITAQPVDPNQSTRAVEIGGAMGAPVVFTKGFLNSGSIGASASSTLTTSTSTAATVTAVGFQVDSFVTLPEIRLSSQSVVAGGNNGLISVSISGPEGGGAAGILITGAPVKDINNVPQSVTSVPVIVIESGARLIVSATVTNPASADAKTLQAVGIEDLSNSLITLTNNGTLSATVTTLTNGVTTTVATLANGVAATAHAVDASSNTVGMTFTNNGAVIGDVLFGAGNDSYTIQGTSNAPATHTGAINFGDSDVLTGTGADSLHVAQYANVAGPISAKGTLDVMVDAKGILSVQNVGTTLATRTFSVGAGTTTSNSGTVNITVSQATGVPVITASQTATLGTNANLSVVYGSFITAGGSFTLISAPTGGLLVSPSDVLRYSAQVGSASTLPFLFNNATISLTTDGAGHDILQLAVVPKTALQLGLTGYARSLFTLANVAINKDPTLGAAMIVGINKSSDPANPNAQAQAAYDAFAPDVSGGARSIAISLTDQATGVVAARQRALRLFGKQPGDLTLWGNEFGEYISTPIGTVSPDPKLASPTPAISSTAYLNSGPAPGFKDHGFGFSLGIDEGAANTGWYGAAFTFYTGDIAEGGDRISKTSTLWYMLTGYSDWRGRGLFVDTQLTVGYANFKGKRFLDLTIPVAGSTTGATFSREADSKRAGLIGSIGATLGANLRYGSATVIPQLSLDGMSLRQEGYTEVNGGTGFNLTVKPYYANSLRVFLGSEFREDLNIGDFFLQPSVRIGYRYDLLNDPAKLHATFADIDPNTALNQPGAPFTVQGPDPARGNYVAGLNLAATTENWTIGLNYDFVRGSNNATEQVGTLSLLGRI